MSMIFNNARKMKKSLSTQGIKLNRFRGIILLPTDGKLKCSKGANNRPCICRVYSRRSGIYQIALPVTCEINLIILILTNMYDG
jgi:hypothetical protein